MTTLMQVLMELPTALIVLLKMTVLLGAGWILHFALVRRNRRWRVLVWRGVIAGLLLLPVAELVLPRLEVAVAPPPAPIEMETPILPYETMAPIQPYAPSAPLATAPVIETPEANSFIAWADVLAWMREHFTILLLAAWGLVTMIMAMRCIFSVKNVRRMVKGSRSAPTHMYRLMETVAEGTSIPNRVNLRLSPDLGSPFLAGLIRPVMVLPERMADEDHADELPAVFAHELAHLNSYDLVWMTLGRWLSVLLWFHPLAWKVRAAHATACEQVCDAVAADYAGGAPAYSRTLARLALELVVDAPTAGGIPMIRTSEITRRLRNLRRGIKAAALARPWVAAAAVLGCVVLTGLGCVSLVRGEQTGLRETEATRGYSGKSTDERTVQFPDVNPGQPLPAIVVEASADEPAAELPGVAVSLRAIVSPEGDLWKPDGSSFDRTMLDSEALESKVVSNYVEMSARESEREGSRTEGKFGVLMRFVRTDAFKGEVSIHRAAPSRWLSRALRFDGITTWDEGKEAFCELVQFEMRDQEGTLPNLCDIDTEISYGPPLKESVDIDLSAKETLYSRDWVTFDATVMNLPEKDPASEVPPADRPLVILRRHAGGPLANYEVRAVRKDGQMVRACKRLYLDGPAWSLGRAFEWGFGWPDPISESSVDKFILIGHRLQPIEWRGISLQPKSRTVSDSSSENASSGPPRGVVVLPNGDPVSGIKVAISVRSLDLGNVRVGAGPDFSTTTGADGRFDFPVQVEPYAIVIVDERGFAFRKGYQLEESPQVVLEPWATVEGELRIGNRAGSNETIALVLTSKTDPVWPHLSYQTDVQSDSEGRFVIEGVPPMSLEVYPQLVNFVLSRRLSEGNLWLHTHKVAVDIQPGRTTRVKLGGTGRPVIGKFKLPAGAQIQIERTNQFNGLVLERKRWEIPVELKGASEEVLERWWKDWLKSDEGKAYRLAYRGYDFVIEPDGTFRIEDVTPGKYHLSVQLRDNPEDGRGTWGDMLASAGHEFTVDEVRGGRSDEPVDLGEMELTVIPRVGQPAPGFELETTDGTRMTLNDFRGKYLLLHFGFAEKDAEKYLPPLKSVYESYGRDDRFAMISLSIGESRDAVAQYAVTHGLKWRQAYLADWSLPKRYGLVTIPWSFLVGPDGNIIAKNLQGETVREAVTDALGGSGNATSGMHDVVVVGQGVESGPSVQNRPQNPPPEHVIRFPETHSVGKLEIRDWNRSGSWYEGWEPFGEARGEVSVPAGKALCLRTAMSTMVNSPSFLAELDPGSLQWLYVLGDLINMRDEHLALLKRFERLTTLTLQETPDITDAGMVHLKAIPSLRRLHLFNVEISDKGLANLAELTSLVELGLVRTQITDEGLARLRDLRSLRRLNLNNNQISDPGLAHLKALTALESLQLRGARVSDAGLRDLRQALPNCRIILGTAAGEPN